MKISLLQKSGLYGRRMSLKNGIKRIFFFFFAITIYSMESDNYIFIYRRKIFSFDLIVINYRNQVARKHSDVVNVSAICVCVCVNREVEKNYNKLMCVNLSSHFIYT